MDAQRFDEFARSLTSARSRRGLLGLGVGAALAAVLGRAEPAEASARCPRGKERCGGRCRAKCPDVKVRNRRTCRCDCPDGMRACGPVCVGDDRCCPGEKECGGGCIAEDVCCPYTEKECPDGACLAKDAGACCPGTEEACASGPRGCCNALAGEACSDDGCCNTLLGQKICGGACCDGLCAEEGGCCPPRRQSPDGCCPSGQHWWEVGQVCCGDDQDACWVGPERTPVCCPAGQICWGSHSGLSYCKAM